jgi:hypothetical protein
LTVHVISSIDLNAIVLGGFMFIHMLGGWYDNYKVYYLNVI